ncbi:MAG TPA: hypothetical protein GXZ51_02960 [Acholeplasma sp.]|jgi:vacuolar-type H+-ATPase subunit F/Vma7|nr:hypothetical protein [Acholeplasma sp.]
MEEKIVAIGTNGNVLLFNSIGITSFVLKPEEVNNKIKELVSKNIEIFIVSENLESVIKPMQEKYKDSPYPIFLMVPIDHKASGVGTEKVRENVKTAIGIDIFKED